MKLWIEDDQSSGKGRWRRKTDRKKIENEETSKRLQLIIDSTAVDKYPRINHLLVDISLIPKVVFRWT